jgi:hypothetical protein
MEAAPPTVRTDGRSLSSSIGARAAHARFDDTAFGISRTACYIDVVSIVRYLKAAPIKVEVAPPLLSGEEAALGEYRHEIRTAATLLKMDLATVTAEAALRMFMDALSKHKTEPLSADYQDAEGHTVLHRVVLACVALESAMMLDVARTAVCVPFSKLFDDFQRQRGATKSFFRDSDLSLRTADGWDALGLITRSNAAGTNWWLTAVLLELGADVNFRGSDGLTPLLRWAVNPSTTYAHMQQMLAHGGDLALTDGRGNTVVHHLVTAGNQTLLEALMLKENLLARSLGICFAPNSAGVTPLQFAASLQSRSPSHGTMHQLIAASVIIFSHRMQPFLILRIRTHLPVVDLARLCCEYIDGGGRPFVSAEAESQLHGRSEADRM